MKNVIRVVGGYDSDAVSELSALHCPEETLTRQEFKDECDINTIIDMFGIGEMPIIPREWTSNVDISDAVSDFQTAMNQVNDARDAFLELPARIRSRFDNNPALFVDFCSDVNNRAEMINLGLVVVPEEAPLPVGTVSS